MTDTPDWHRIALALNNVATTLQQLAVEVDAAARATRVVIPEGQLSVEELRAQLAARPVCDRFTPPAGGGYVCQRCRHEFLEHVPEPASVAEPECGCSAYARCDLHEAQRPKGCKCNGPDWPSSECPNATHRSNALAAPHHDVAKWE